MKRNAIRLLFLLNAVPGLSLAQSATSLDDPAGAYYALAESYREGRLARGRWPHLAQTARRIRDTTFAREVALAYANAVSEKELMQRENLKFLAAFTESSSDRVFKVLYRNAAGADSGFGMKGFAHELVDRVIAAEDIKRHLVADRGGAPDWRAIERAVGRKYDSATTDRAVLRSRVGWYQTQASREDWLQRRALWPRYTESVVRLVRDYAWAVEPNSVFLNNSAWAVFLYSADEAELRQALTWAERVLGRDSLDAATMDTRANLLYKLGQRDIALRYQERAASLAPQMTELQVTLEKMRRGEPTWP